MTLELSNSRLVLLSLAALSETDFWRQNWSHHALADKFNHAVAIPYAELTW